MFGDYVGYGYFLNMRRDAVFDLQWGEGQYIYYSYTSTCRLDEERGLLIVGMG